MEDKVKKHFEEEAVVYDDVIVKLIPYYKEIVSAITSSIPFSFDNEIDVIDLGCGTGTISQAIKNVYPKAQFTCVDIAENMLQQTQQKIGSDHCFINADFNNFEFVKKYDLIVSSLAIHHLESDEEKKNFYDKIYKALKKGGIFINGDVVEATADIHQRVFVSKWIEYMNRSVDMDTINNKWLPGYYSKDRPISLMKHLKMLEESGFINIDVIWKYYGYAVYTGSKKV